MILGNFIFVIITSAQSLVSRASHCFHLQDKLDDLAFKTLTDYQGATVSLLSLISAGTGDVSSDFMFFFLSFLFFWCVLNFNA